MENVKKLFVVVFVTIGIFFGSRAVFTQTPISISWPQPTLFGTTIQMNIDTTISTATLNLGSTTGGPQTWIYNEVVDEWQVNYETIAVAGTPFEAAFGDAEWANHICQYIPQFLIFPATIDDIYTYKRLEGGWIEELGMGTDNAIIRGSPFIYPTPADVYPDPLTWNAADWLEKRIFQPSFLDLFLGTISDSTIISVDAWGTLTVPSGTYQCLRLKRHEFRNIVVPGFYTDLLETYTYVWLTYGFDMVLSVTADASQGENFTTALYVIRAESSVGVECDPKCETSTSLPSEYTLGQNYPNPFNPSTSIRYALPNPANVELKVYSILGQELATLVSDIKTAGIYRAIWDGRDLSGRQTPAGIYFYQLKATPLDNGETIVQTKKMLMTK